MHESEKNDDISIGGTMAIRREYVLYGLDLWESTLVEVLEPELEIKWNFTQQHINEIAV